MEAVDARIRIGGFLASRGIPLRMRGSLYEIVGNFALRLARHASQGDRFISPQRVVDFTANFLAKNTTITTKNEFIEIFCRNFRNDFSFQPDFSLNHTAKLFEELGLFPQLFDWAVFNNLAKVDLFEEGSSRETAGDKIGAKNYFTRIVEGYGRGESTLNDTLNSLKGLLRIDPADVPSREQLAQFERKIRERTDIVPHLGLTTELFAEQWKQAKDKTLELIEASDAKAYLAGIPILAKYAEKEDRERIKHILLKFYYCNQRFEPSEQVLLDAFINIMEPGDLAEILSVIEDRSHQGNPDLAFAMVKRLNYREIIPSLIDWFAEKENKAVIEDPRLYTLMELLKHEDLGLMFDCLRRGGRHLPIAAAILPLIVVPEDALVIRSMLNDASGKSAVVLINVLSKIGNSGDVARITPFLGQEKEVACAAAEAIGTLSIDDEGHLNLLRSMQDHIYPDVVGLALKALFRLRHREAVDAAIKEFQSPSNDFHTKEAVRKVIIEEATPEDLPIIGERAKDLVDSIREKPTSSKSLPLTTEQKLIELQNGNLREEEYHRRLHGFLGEVTSEDLAADRWKIRTAMLTPSDPKRLRVALDVIRHFNIHEVFPDLVRSVELLVPRTFLSQTMANSMYYYIWTILKLAREEDLGLLQRLSFIDNAEVRKCIAKTAAAQKNWMLIHEIRTWVKDVPRSSVEPESSKEARIASIAYAADTMDWGQMVAWLENADQRQENLLLTKSFAEVATLERLPRLVEMLSHPNGAIKAAALAGISRLAVNPPEERIMEPTVDRTETQAILGRQELILPKNREELVPFLLEKIRNCPKERFYATMMLADINAELPDPEVEGLIELSKTHISIGPQVATIVANQENGQRFFGKLLEAYPSFERAADTGHKQQQVIRALTRLGTLEWARSAIGQNYILREAAIVIFDERGEESDGEFLLGWERSQGRGNNDVRRVGNRLIAQKVKNPREVAALRRMLTNRNIFIRRAAIEIAEELGLLELLPIIIARFKDNFKDTSDVALKFMVKYGSRDEILPTIIESAAQEIPGIIDAVFNCLTEENLPLIGQWIKEVHLSRFCPQHALVAIRAAVKFNQPQYLPEIIEWAKSTDERVALEALKAIKKIGTPELLFDALLGVFISNKEHLSGVADAVGGGLGRVQLENFYLQIEHTNPGYSQKEFLRQLYFILLHRLAPAEALQRMRLLIAQNSDPSGIISTNELFVFGIAGEIGEEGDIAVLARQLGGSAYYLNQEGVCGAIAKILKRSKSGQE